jgi:hypothetical protein
MWLEEWIGCRALCKAQDKPIAPDRRGHTEVSGLAFAFDEDVTDLQVQFL